MNSRRQVREIAKSVCWLLAAIVTLPLWVTVRLGVFTFGAPLGFVAFGQGLSLVPSLLGVLLRRGYYSMAMANVSRDAFIEFGTWLSQWETSIGRRFYVGANCIIGCCVIGDDVLIGSSVHLLSGKRQHGVDSVDKPINQQSGEFTTLTVADNVWIGSGAIVMADIGEGAVIGAGSVVVDPLPPLVVAVGNPCVVKRQRIAAPLATESTLDRPA